MNEQAATLNAHASRSWISIQLTKLLDVLLCRVPGDVKLIRGTVTEYSASFFDIGPSVTVVLGDGDVAEHDLPFDVPWIEKSNEIGILMVGTYVQALFNYTSGKWEFRERHFGDAALAGILVAAILAIPWISLTQYSPPTDSAAGYVLFTLGWPILIGFGLCLYGIQKGFRREKELLEKFGRQFKEETRAVRERQPCASR